MSLYENKYRVTYEAFSKFSAKISKADNKKELLAIMETHLKYLFNYKYFRVLIKDEDSIKSFNIFQNSICPTEFILDVVFDYEEKLLAKNIPLYQNTDGSFLKEYQEQHQICEGSSYITGMERHPSCYICHCNILLLTEHGPIYFVAPATC